MGRSSFPHLASSDARYSAESGNFSSTVGAADLSSEELPAGGTKSSAKEGEAGESAVPVCPALSFQGSAATPGFDGERASTDGGGAESGWPSSDRAMGRTE